MEEIFHGKIKQVTVKELDYIYHIKIVVVQSLKLSVIIISVYIININLFIVGVVIAVGVVVVTWSSCKHFVIKTCLTMPKLLAKLLNKINIVF